ncbi:MAG TPA: MoaD/ThiS family protein [Dissulfurispiraceae bacterium]
MTIKVKLFASLRNFGPDEQIMELSEPSTLEDLAATLRLPPEIPLLRVVNGEIRKPDYSLSEGDEIAFFPPIAGGCPADGQWMG